MPEGWEWVVLAIVAVLLFGGTRLAGIGKSAGRAIREFKEETAAVSKEKESATPEVTHVDAKEAGSTEDADTVTSGTSTPTGV